MDEQEINELEADCDKITYKETGSLSDLAQIVSALCGIVRELAQEVKELQNAGQ